MENQEISPAQRTGIFITLIGGIFVTSMSTTVTANMIPNFADYFEVSANLAQWLTSGATLVSGLIIPVTAFLNKRVSNRIYFFAAMLLYTLSSLSAFLTPQNLFFMMLISRLVQAIGCGMMIPFGQLVLLNLYPTDRHGRVMAAFSMASMTSSLISPTYAGLILEAVGWRGVFVSLFIFGIIILILGAVFMRNVIPRSDAELNVGFVLLSSFGLACFLIGISNIGGGSLIKLTSGGLITLGIIFIAIFAKLQLVSEKPMLNLHVFKESSFSIAIIISICMYLISMGTCVIMPLFTKTIRGFSDSYYGYATVLGSFLALFTTLYAGKLYDKIGIKPMFIAGIILYFAHFFMGICFSDISGIIYISLTYAVQTVAMSALNSPATTMALSRLSGTLRIDGSAVFNTMRQASSALSSMLAVLIYTLAGSDIGAIHVVYIYFGIVTVLIVVTFLLYLKVTSNKDAENK